jgi:hypothetical protein
MRSQFRRSGKELPVTSSEFPIDGYLFKTNRTSLCGFFSLLLALGLHFVVWFVPILIANAVAVSIIGVLLASQVNLQFLVRILSVPLLQGPIYPIVMVRSLHFEDYRSSHV